MITKTRILLILACLIWHVNPKPLFSQSIEYINGKVINSISHEPVPFATVILKNNQLGVFTNLEGDFKIIHNPKFQSDSLIITCIGFKRHSLAFNELNEVGVNIILLTPDIYAIGEVRVKATKRKVSSNTIINSTTIIRRAIRNIKINYPNNPFNYISYYRDYQKREKEYINLNEAIIQTLDNGFSSKSVSNKYQLLDYRKNMDFRRMNISPYYDTIVSPGYNSYNKVIPDAKLPDQGGNELFVLMVHDAIRNFNTRSFSFIETFSDNFLYNHDFSEPIRVYNNNLLLYKISFNAKPRITGDSLMVSGTIYIQPKDYSIHKLEYSCSYFTKEKEKKEIFNIDIEYGYENAVDSLMSLKYISFNNIFDVVDKDDSSYFRRLDSYWVSGSRMIVEFNNKIDPKSAVKRENYEIWVRGKKAKIYSISVKDRLLYINLKDEILGNKDSSFINIKNIKDINGNILNNRKIIELHQYRELFVQEYNKSPIFKDSCYMHYLPMEQNCISVYTGKDKFWMNTPENIKVDK